MEVDNGRQQLLQRMQRSEVMRRQLKPIALDPGYVTDPVHVKPCNHCQKAPPEDGEKPFRRCGGCVKLGVPVPAVYCSPECQRNDWLQHKRLHKEQSEHMHSQVQAIADHQGTNACKENAENSASQEAIAKRAGDTFYERFYRGK
eukprot:5827988-Prymnesium_polylepis.1